MEKKFFCRNCKGERNHNLLFEKKIRGSEDDGSYQWIEEYLTVECSGCETISFVKIFGDNSMYTSDEEGNFEYYTETNVFPYFLEKGNEISNIHFVPEVIRIVYKESINAFKAKCYILTAGGFRATIEALCNHLRIKKADLSIRINLLHEKGFLTKNESKRLHSIRFLGNDSLHEIEKPKVHQLLIVLEIVNHLLENLFIHDKIIEGKIDSIIDKYDDFLNLLNRLTTNDKIGKEYTINELIGKSKRLIKKEDLVKFEETLQEEIKEGKIKFLTIASIDEKGVLKFKIESFPDYAFGW